MKAKIEFEITPQGDRVVLRRGSWTIIDIDAVRAKLGSAWRDIVPLVSFPDADAIAKALQPESASRVQSKDEK